MSWYICHTDWANSNAILLQEIPTSKQPFLLRPPGRCPCSDPQLLLWAKFCPIKRKCSRVYYVDPTTEGAMSFEHSWVWAQMTWSLVNAQISVLGIHMHISEWERNQHGHINHINISTRGERHSVLFSTVIKSHPLPSQGVGSATFPPGDKPEWPRVLKTDACLSFQMPSPHSLNQEEIPHCCYISNTC